MLRGGVAEDHRVGWLGAGAAKFSKPGGVVICRARSGSCASTRKVCGNPTGNRTKSPGPAWNACPSQLNSAVPGQQVEHFVFVQVPVQRRGEPGRIEELRHGEAAAGLGSGDLEGDEVAEEPQGFAVVLA